MNEDGLRIQECFLFLLWSLPCMKIVFKFIDKIAVWWIPSLAKSYFRRQREFMLKHFLISFKDKQKTVASLNLSIQTTCSIWQKISSVLSVVIYSEKQKVIVLQVGQLFERLEQVNSVKTTLESFLGKETETAHENFNMLSQKKTQAVFIFLECN